MSHDVTIQSHYTTPDLLQSIQAAIDKAGIAPSALSVADLGPLDEFHTGGRVATEHLVEQLAIEPGQAILDIGCGIGGTARFLADRYKVRVTGIDLTDAYVATGRALNTMVSLDNAIALEVGDASAAAFPDRQFDHVTMLHVGMNIADKPALFTNVHRMLVPGGSFALYDVMRLSDGDIEFPVPWASDPSTSHVAPADDYRRALEQAGFSIQAVTPRGDFARTFFQAMKARAEAGEPPPPIGLQVLVGDSFRSKMANFAAAVMGGVVEPTEILAIRQ